MAFHWALSSAQFSDAEAIASLFAQSWTSGFTRLQFGHVDARTFTAAMAPRIAQQMLQPHMLFMVARHPATHETVGVAQWAVPSNETLDTVMTDSQEGSDERQEFEDEAYKNSLPEDSNRDLIMEFTVGLRNLREHVLQGRRHFLLENIAVRPDSRGKGLASQLIEWIFPKADKQTGLVYLDTASDNNAIRMYRRLGFEEEGSHTIDDLSRFGGKEEIDRLGCGTMHTHVAFVRYPKSVG